MYGKGDLAVSHSPKKEVIFMTKEELIILLRLIYSGKILSVTINKDIVTVRIKNNCLESD